MQDIRLSALLMASVAIFPAFTDAFWRLPCHGQSGFGRIDPIVNPGEISSHVHVVHGGGNFGMTADTDSLRKSECTSCAVKQDKSAYWAPAMYFIHSNGSAQMVNEVGGMLAYYLLYGESPEAFPKGFRMLAGDPFQRNFTMPVPDPPKSLWSGEESSQRALAQKALGFNCMNYDKDAEPSLYRHFMPKKNYLDEHCPDGLRLELQFPSCWNGKDADSHDHKSHVAYPSTVNNGECPEGYETRLVSLFYETIWDTYAFKDNDGYFALANGDPTGYGYHGDFIFGWEDGVLEDAVKKCTNPSGMVEDCPVFDLQSQSDSQQCTFEMPSELKEENVMMHDDGLPGPMTVAWGPEYAMADGMHKGSSPTSTAPALPGIPTLSVPDLSLSLGFSIGGNKFFGAETSTPEPAPTTSATPTTTATPTTSAAPSTTETPTQTPTETPTTTSTPTSTSTPTPTPTPTTSYAVDTIAEEIIFLEKDVAVLVNLEGVPYSTETRATRTVSTTFNTISETSTVVSYVARDNVPAAPEEAKQAPGRAARRHAHHHHNRHHRPGF